jgi:acyl carrier protein phosphodiesterase
MPAPPGIPINIDSKDRQEIFRAITSGTANGTQLGLEMLRTRYLDMSQRYDSMETLFRQLAPNLVTDELRSWVSLFRWKTFNIYLN